MDPLETLRALVYQTPDEALRDQLWDVLSDLSATGEPDTLQIAVDYLKDHLSRWPEALRIPPESFHSDPTLHVKDPRFDLLPPEPREASLRRFIHKHYTHPPHRARILREAFEEPPAPEQPPEHPQATERLPEGVIFAALSQDLEALGRWRDEIGHCEPTHLAEVTLRWLQAADARGVHLSWDHGRIWNEVSDNLRDPLEAARHLVALVGGCAGNPSFFDELLADNTDEAARVACVREVLGEGLVPGGVHLLRWLIQRGRTASEVDLFILGLTGEKAVAGLCMEALVGCPPALLTPALTLLEGGPATARRSVAQLFEQVTDEAWLAPLRQAIAVTRPGPTHEALRRSLFWNRLAVLVRADPGEEGDADIEAALVSLLGECVATSDATALPRLRTLGGTPLPESAVCWLLAVLQKLDPERSRTAPALVGLRCWLDDGDCASLFDALQARSRATGHPEHDRILILNALSFFGDDTQLSGFCEALDSTPRLNPWLERGLALFRRALRPSAIVWCASWKRYSGLIALSEGAAEVLRHHAKREGLSEPELIERHFPRQVALRHRRWLAVHLEEAMIAGRVWAPEAWRPLFAHPFVLQVAQGLVVEAFTETSRTLMRLSEASRSAPSDAALRIPHPLDLTLSELELARSLGGAAPFSQLDRGEPGDDPPTALIPPGRMPCERLHDRLRQLGFDPVRGQRLTTRARRQFGPDLFVSIVHSGYDLGPFWLDGGDVEVLDVLAHREGQRTPWSRLPEKVSLEVCRAIRALS